MKLFKKITDQFAAHASEKLVEAGTQLAGQFIDKTAAKAATLLGEEFGKPILNQNQQFISDYQKQEYLSQVLNGSNAQPSIPAQELNTPPAAPQPSPAQMPQNPYPYSYPPFPGYEYPYPMGGIPQARLSVENHFFKLEEDKVKRIAEYKTNLFFRINKIGKDTIQYVGLKIFSHKLHESELLIQSYESGQLSDEKAYKKAKYKLEKVGEIKSMSDDAEQEKLFRTFVYDVILEELILKNERGELRMPSVMEITLQQLGFHAWKVFTPNESIEAFLNL